MKRFFLIFTILLFVTVGIAQKRVIPLPLDSNTVPTPNSFMYFLPKSAFEVTVTIEKKEFYKGYYTDYAEKMLGITNPITENKKTFQIKNIEINSFIIPDSTFQFLVEMSKQQIKSNFYTQILNDQILKKDHSIAYNHVQPEEISTFFMYYSNQKQLEKEESYVETKIIDGVLTQVPVNKTKKITKSTEQQAQEAADFITKIRKDRYNIITANHEVGFSKEAIQLMIDQLDQLEKNYMELFIGTTVEQVIKVKMVVIPENRNDLSIPLFTFNETQGVLNQQPNAKGDHYELRFIPQANLDLYEQQLNQWGQNDKFQKNGYQFRVPIPAKLIMFKNNTMFHDFGTYLLFQIGNMRTLPVYNDHFLISKYAIIY